MIHTFIKISIWKNLKDNSHENIRKCGGRVKASVCVCVCVYTSDRRSISFFYYAYLIVLELFIKSIASQENFNGVFVREVFISTWVCFWALSLSCPLANLSIST